MIPSKSAVHEISIALRPALEGLDRRSFLKGGLYLGAGIASTLTLGGCSGSLPPVPKDIQHLSASQVATVERLIEILLPVEGTQLTAITQVPILKNVDAMLGSMDESVRPDILMLFDLFEYGPLISSNLSRFTTLSTEDAVAYIENWQSSGLFIQRAIMAAMKKFIYVSYWRDEATWTPVEFDGAVSNKWGIPRLGNAPLPTR